VVSGNHVTGTREPLYFLKYSEVVSNDFILSQGGQKLELLASDTDDWRITFADTGLKANIGMRLRAVRKHVAGEEYFLANYGDTLTDAPLGLFIEEFRRSGRRPLSSRSSPPTPST
jgi:glucose-1-phosphate cytidylyltransferase